MSDRRTSTSGGYLGHSDASSDNYQANGGTSATRLPKQGGGRRKRIASKDITAQIAADLLIGFCNEHGDVLTNLRLQKLLYYIQAWYLALYGKPLFPDEIEAWDNGPAVPQVFARFAHCSHNPISQSVPTYDVPRRVSTHISDLMEAYGHLSSFDLEILSCDEEPWRNARARASETNLTPKISQRSMMQFYKRRMNEHKEEKQED